MVENSSNYDYRSTDYYDPFNNNFSLNSINHNLGNTSTNASANAAECGSYEAYPMHRVVYIMVASCFATTGFFCNLLLMYIFPKNVQRMSQQFTSSLYLTFLAFLDSCLCFNYVLIFGVDAYINLVRSVRGLVYWHGYTIPLFALSKIVQLMIPMIIICITTERYLLTKIQNNKSSSRHSSVLMGKMLHSIWLGQRGKKMVVAFIICSAMMLKSPSYFELYVHKTPDCPDPLGRISMGPTKMRISTEYQTFTAIMTAIQVFLPFCILMFMNLSIIRTQHEVRKKLSTKADMAKVISEKSKSQHRESQVPCDQVELFNFSASRILEQQIRSHLIKRDVVKKICRAKYSLVALVTSHLISNGMQVFVYLAEKVASEELDKNRPLYSFLTDTESILFMMSSAVRFAIYTACIPELRRILRDMLSSACGFVRKKSEKKEWIGLEDGEIFV